jgi:hypothetical protein
MQVELLAPTRGSVSLEALRGLAAEGHAAAPFHPSIVNAAADLSRRLFRTPAARNYPELQALAFWMRPAELRRLACEFEALETANRVPAPRGLVFHVPPRNVDTMFVYSWLLAALTGNQNVIRLSPQRSESTGLLLDLFRETLAAAEEPARSGTLVVSYGHEQEPTDLLSALCDVRVIWGGDHTVAAIRRSPLPPRARDISFPDRYSLSAIHTESYLALSTQERDRLAEDFFADSFWFNQLACSSPRLVIWCGGGDEAAAASRDLFGRVAESQARRGYTPAAATTMQKFVFSCGAAIDLPIHACRRHGDITILTLASLDGFRRDHPGGGLFFEAYVARLDDIAAVLQRKDQTLTWFGFPPDELRCFVRNFAARAVDRLVPIGQALQFNRFWDGYDLLQEFCRYVYLESSPPLRPMA